MISAYTLGPTPKEQLDADARRFVSTGLWCSGLSVSAVALVVIVLLVLATAFDASAAEVIGFGSKVATIPLLAGLFGSIRLAQGVLMLLTGMRIELEGRHRLNGNETLLTGVFAFGWVAMLVGGFALVMLGFH